MDSVLLLIFLLFMSILLWRIFFRKEYGNPPPGPQGLPVVGNLLSMLNNHPRKLAEWSQIYGRTVGVRMGNRQIVALHDPEHAKAVLSDSNTTGRDQDFIFGSYFQGKGISLSEGSLWKEQRRFAMTSLRNLGMGKGWLEDTMLTEIAQLIHTFGTFSLPFNPCSHLTLSVSNNICALLLGKRFQHSDKKFIRLCGLFGENFRLTAHLLPVGFLPFLKDVPFSRFRKLIRLFFKNIEDVKTFCQQLITEHKLKLAGDAKDEDKQDFIDRYLAEQNKQIIQHGSKMSFEDEQLLYTVINLLSAGTETTTTSLLWSFIFMIKYPEIQRKCQEEIDANVGRDRTVRLADKGLLKYTEATILDVQRLGSVAPTGAAHANFEAMKIDGFDVPARSMIIVNIYAIHRDPKLWKKPLELCPEHFLDESGNVFIPKGFLPFGIGKRICAGESLAKMELYLYFANLLQKFDIQGDFKSLPDVNTIPVGLIHAPTPYNIRFIPRY